MSENYIAPVFTGMVEMYTGSFADLVGTFWHPFDGRSITDVNGLTVTTVDPNNRYLMFASNSGTTSQHIPKPTNTLTLGGGAHDHSNGTKARVYWNTSNHSHNVNFKYNNLGGGYSGNVRKRKYNGYNGSYASISNWAVVYKGASGAGEGAHGHNTTLKCNSENLALHNHTPSNNVTDKIVGDSNKLRMPD